ncbi:delta(14)-sterol reductase LBR isoform X1 [Dunckerocampus dactyliophorus]|uniref:delta(14)-sterol reductase LBR isoform X1 n=1 Tax=Dunckerocampus dactyliophorus TaxID=161453 RepID=UPI002404A8AD|nr:delta(14)-sterol reductase LBR isoform X1 [Dunckerocampus dactyliophorus]XP_054617833.1 delta(14)-sterol reductase LBR isoform X1 [Dunckerocampus dactyliophorus]XP_054617834.1 delta(14)-sterol reductase LBR isoform X1 [Dunckerocampus dactyliophorus]XP_054617836.1 delta(14)-sterol reductase LBR isoform X1 [Dunckerocampus dactyliophorus]XP_054617837.1 delta(14)-sterol reductase LBR isoform X1 [Dunckerocampus dactyliophorus]
MPSVKYQKGDMVMGRWPGSNLYYEVKVLGFDVKSQLYTVIYKDGTELELKEQDIRVGSHSFVTIMACNETSAFLFQQCRSRLFSFNNQSSSGFQIRTRSRSRSPGRRRSRSRSPARTTRRSSSRAAAAAASAAIAESTPSSRKETKLKDMVEVRVVPLATENNSNNKHEKKEENNAATKENEKSETKRDSEPEKNQGRYNLRRRKDEAKLEQQEKKDANVVTAPTPMVSRPLDFGGKIGAYFWLLFLPSWVLFVVLQVNLKDPSLANFPPPVPPLETFWDAQALGFVVLWILFQAILYILPVGKLSEGMPLRSGERLKYRTNGFFAIVMSAAVVAAAVHQGVDLTYIHSHFLQLAVATFLISVLLSVYLYVRSLYAAPGQLALGGSSGNVVYDFFKGHELNPRIKDFDLKFFCEMRPGLIGWCLINFALALAEMKQWGLASPSYAMILVNAFQLLYVVDGLWNEEAILTTMDLMHDGFGFMLAFGDLVWVPFTYTLQAYYLVSHPNALSLPAVVAIVLLKLVGFYIFRKSNSEKNAFRRSPSDPKLSHLKTIPTATGKSLLVSGWWGVVRHPNYLGDLIMALAWSLPCGFSHLLPWYYMIYFIILLVHRDSRDMSECRRKYGSAWDEYCRTVRYRIIPRVY